MWSWFWQWRLFSLTSERVRILRKIPVVIIVKTGSRVVSNRIEVISSSYVTDIYLRSTETINIFEEELIWNDLLRKKEDKELETWSLLSQKLEKVNQNRSMTSSLKEHYNFRFFREHPNKLLAILLIQLVVSLKRKRKHYLSQRLVIDR